MNCNCTGLCRFPPYTCTGKGQYDYYYYKSNEYPTNFIEEEGYYKHMGIKSTEKPRYRVKAGSERITNENC